MCEYKKKQSEGTAMSFLPSSSFLLYLTRVDEAVIVGRFLPCKPGKKASACKRCKKKKVPMNRRAREEFLFCCCCCCILILLSSTSSSFFLPISFVSIIGRSFMNCLHPRRRRRCRSHLLFLQRAKTRRFYSYQSCCQF